MPKICIDPGHGGTDSGAVGPGGLMEKHVVLRVAQFLTDFLPGSVTHTLTRTGDQFISLSHRAEISNDSGADLFLSIHCNAARGRGFECFTSPGDTGADQFATHLLEAYREIFPDRVMRADFRDGDADKEARFTVLTKTRAPAALFELEFIDTESGEAFLRNSSNQKMMGKALADGIISYLGLGEDDDPIPPVRHPNEGAILQRLSSMEEEIREIRRLLTS